MRLKLLLGLCIRRGAGIQFHSERMSVLDKKIRQEQPAHTQGEKEERNIWLWRERERERKKSITTTTSATQCG